MNNPTYAVGVVGYGKMGAEWCEHLSASDRWSLQTICDLSPDRRAAAQQRFPDVKVVDAADALMADPAIPVVALTTLADARPALLRQALDAGKHIMAEKPLAPDVPTEWELLDALEASDRLSAVNLFNRNAWYHEQAHAFIEAGQIGQLGLIRVCHMTAGTLPGVRHEPEGPPFRNCGMHYIDVARWYAHSDIAQWHAQGLRMWDEPRPWWVTVHGTFDNGIAFEVTNGFVYGQAARDRANNSSTELLGTHGFIAMDHDFDQANCRFHGTDETRHFDGPYGGKQIGVLVERFAQALDTGDASRLPSPRDGVIASDLAQQMLEAAERGPCPSIGNRDQLRDLIALRTAGDPVSRAGA